ncbi:MAG: hypothetical protein H6808_07200 [Phycisphaera sp.]|nr:hypothetical protein [Phycisphaera sp.]
MARTKVQPRDTEVPFKAEDLIFSTTDNKGFIRSADEVFVQMSRYPLTDMLGQPHSMVRHPAMPRCVFQLLWDYIKDGKPIGAYVKNMASDGSYYNVFALVSPLTDGYLSVRLKPTSKFFHAAHKIYPQLLACENNLANEGKTTAQCIVESSKLLGTLLKESGFESYDAFMYAALEEEMRSRDEQIHQTYRCNLWELNALSPSQVMRGKPDAATLSVLHAERSCNIAGKTFERVSSLLALQASLNKNARAIMRVADTLGMSSINVSLEATRLGEHGRCLSVIASHLGETSQTISTLADSLQNQIEVTSVSLGSAVFRLASTRLQTETMLAFSRKIRSASADAQATPEDVLSKFPRQQVGSMLGDLQYSIEQMCESLRPTVTSLIQDMRRLETDITNVKRAMLTLRFAQLGGKIESSRLSDDAAVITLIESIGTEIVNTVSQISELESDMLIVGSDLKATYRQFDDLAASLTKSKEAQFKLGQPDKHVSHSLAA